MKNIFKSLVIAVLALVSANVLAASKEPSATLDVIQAAGSDAYYSVVALPNIKNLDWVGYNNTGSGNGGCLGEENHWKLNGERTITFKVKNCEKVEVKDSYFSKDATENLKYSINGSAATSFATNGSNKKTCASGSFNTNNTGEITIVLSADNDIALGTINFYPTGGSTPVTPTVTSVTVSPATATLEVNNTQQLSATVVVTPDNTDNKKVTWTSSNTAVATVSESGLVTAVAQGSATITATSTVDNTKSGTCTVTVNAPSTIIDVTAISIKTTTSIQVGASETLTITYTPANANTGKEVSWKSDNTAVATVDNNGKVSGVAAGSTTITATSTTNSNIKASCTVTVEPKSDIPDVGLVAHTPEIYEETKENKGYGGTLSQFEGREYEVYYIGRDASDQPSVAITPSGDKVKGITTSTSATTCKADDNWFELKSSGGKGGDTNAGAKDEFTDASKYSIKMKSNQEMVFQVKGFDQFNFYGKDNNKDKTKGKQFEVYVDDTKVSGDPVDGYAIHRYKINTEEHVIRLVAIGDSESKLTGFSLRVSDEPLVRHLSGPKTQTVYQTKNIQTVAFRIRRAAKYQLTWGSNAIDGVTLRAGGNDSVYLEGTANAAAGIYTYKVEALNAAGEVKSVEQGKITIETHVFDAAKGNDFSTNIAEPIKPLNFLFYASNSNDIQLNCDIQGLTLTYNRDSIAVLSGTPVLGTTEGEHTYSITAVGGNTVTGKITIVVPDPYFEPIAEVKGKDNQPLSFSLIARHASEVTVTGLPDGFKVEYDATTDIATVSGTPNVGPAYPKSFTFTATAKPRYEGKSTTTETGKLTIIDPNAKTILVVCKGLTAVADEPVAEYLQTRQYDITLRQQEELAGSSYEAFNLILISESVDADNAEVLNLIRGGEKAPVLNMKGFTYAPNRLNWGRPNNGSIDTTSQGATKIYVQREDHTIFKNLNKKHGDSIAILEYEKEKQGVMPVEVRMDDFSYCLATAHTRDINEYYLDGELQTVLHEIPADQHGGSKYMCLPIARKSKLSNDGKRLVNAIVEYLLKEDQETLDEPALQIIRFAVDGIEGDIDEFNKTILVTIDTLTHSGLDFKALKTDIELKDPVYTYVKPADGSEVDYQYATSRAVAFIVSDYIRRETYNVKFRLTNVQGLEEAYEIGQWVNIYDIYGRLLTTTNDNIYTMDLPRGIYLVVTENGQTIKIMR